MATSNKKVRQSVSLPLGVARRVRNIAQSKRSSANRVLVDLIERGIDSHESEKQKFFTLAGELIATKDPRRQRKLKEQLARMTFGE